MGRPIMIVLAIIFGMALLAVLYVIFKQPIRELGYDITSTSRNIMNNASSDTNSTVSPFAQSINWLIK